MDYSNKVRVESKKYAGVSFVIRKITVRRRAALVELQAEAMAKLRPVQELIAPLSKEYRIAVEAAKALVQPARAEAVAAGISVEDAAAKFPITTLDFPEEKLEALLKYSNQLRKIEMDELIPIAVEFAWVGIEGLTIEGEPATLAMLRADCGPDGLYDEIATAVKAEAELSVEERENLASPSTSAAAVDGAGRNGTAMGAERLVTITPKDAPNSTDRESASAPGIATVQ